MLTPKILLRCIIILLVIILGLVISYPYKNKAIKKELLKLGKYRKTYDFSTNYFAPNAENWRFYLKEFAGKPNVKYLEVGVFEGSSFIWVLENILTDPSASGIAIDPFFGRSETTFRSNIQRTGDEKKATVIKGFSFDELPKLAASSFDIIYIDADHRAKNVYLDIALSWRLLRVGGILIFDDYLLNLNYPVDMRPKTAIDAFIAAFGDELDIVHDSYQLVLRKKPVECPILYCSAVGRYAYVWWPERILFHLPSKTRVQLSEKEKSLMDWFLTVYADQRRNRNDALKVISSNKDLRDLDEKLKLFE